MSNRQQPPGFPQRQFHQSEDRNRRRTNRAMTRARKATIAAAAALAALLLAAFLYDRGHAGQVAAGITVAGVDVGGMSRGVAKHHIGAELEAPLVRPVRLKVDGDHISISASDVNLRVDTDAMVEDAIAAGRGSNFVVRAVRDVVGAEAHKTVALEIAYARSKVKRIVKRIAKDKNRPAKDARVEFTQIGVGQVDGQIGRQVRTGRLTDSIRIALTTPGARRTVKVPIKKIKPKVTRSQLAGKYPTAITIDRANFKLRLFKDLKLDRSYGIAVGQVGLETPAGLYSINNKAIEPAWHVPDREWAGKLRGKVIPGGAPNNPLKARWLGIYDGVGIHGTGDPGSIGSRASHGCVRMRVDEVIELYEVVPVGTPVYIGG